MISAKEARYLASKTSLIECAIASAAADGSTSVRYCAFTDEYSLKELLDLGYKVEVTKLGPNLNDLEISWRKE